MTDVLIVGAGGHGREVHDALLDASHTCTGFLDDHEPDAGLLARIGARWLGPTVMLTDMPAGTRYLVGIGNGSVRRKIDTLAGHLEPFTLIHPAASVGRDVRVAPGVVVFAQATVTTNITIGRHSHVGRGAAVGHDTTIGDYVSIYPNAAVSGNVTLEDEVTVGTTACILQGLHVAGGAYVGAGAVVTRDLPANVTATGVPARFKTP